MSLVGWLPSQSIYQRVPIANTLFTAESSGLISILTWISSWDLCQVDGRIITVKQFHELTCQDLISISWTKKLFSRHQLDFKPSGFKMGSCIRNPGLYLHGYLITSPYQKAWWVWRLRQHVVAAAASSHAGTGCPSGADSNQPLGAYSC